MALFDRIIDQNIGNKAGEWACRKIDYLRSLRFADEALKFMDAHIGYPEVGMKYYHELVNEGRWREAIALLDRAQEIEENTPDRFIFNKPDWLGLKQELLDEHGTEEEKLENMKRMFYTNALKRDQYYHQLKEMVAPTDWKEFYQGLFAGLSDEEPLSAIGQFLVEEKEYDWLFRLVEKRVKDYPTDYRTPLQYAAALSETRHDEISRMLTATVKEYAADRFKRKKSVNTSKYSYFCDDLKSIADAGYPAILRNLVEYLLIEYRFRPSLVRELRSIPLP